MIRRSTRFQFVMVLVGGLWLPAGCAQPRAFDALWVTPRPYHARQQAARPSANLLQAQELSSAAHDVINPTGGISLHDAVWLALGHSPALVAEGWKVAAAEADARKMGRSPNPRASLAIENFAGPDGGSTLERQTLRLSQVIELAGKRAKRQALGEATQRLRAWDYEQQRIDIAAQTAIRYVSVIVSQKQVALAQQQLVLAETAHDVVEDRVRNSVSPGMERDQSATRVALSRIALEEARQTLAADRAGLAEMWGADQPTFDTAIGELDTRIDLPALDDLKHRLADSPAFARWEDELESRRRAVELERANAVADPAIGAGVRYFPDAESAAGVVELSMPLTLLDDNHDNILAAELRVSQTEAQRRQAIAQANRSLRQAYSRLQAAAFALRALADEAIPRSQMAYDAAIEAYQAGLEDYLTVLDTERTLLNIRNRRLQALKDYHTNLIAIERLTAHPINDIHE